MSLVDRIFGSGRGSGAIDLSVLTETFAEAAPRLERQTLDRELVRARLMDGYRAVELDPVGDASLSALLGPLDEGGWCRLALEVTALDRRELRGVLRDVMPTGGVREQVEVGFVGPAREHRLLTMDLLRQSSIRIEEMARHFAHALGLRIAGESERDSAERRRRLDYARLLDEAERAKAAAEERSEELRKRLEEEYARMRRPRGKW